MIFGGMQKNSMIDYPGKISCVLFACGCNFSCPYCHNPQLARGCKDNMNAFNEKTASDFLEGRKGFLEGVVISGGEPTLQADLPAVCEKIKGMGYPVKLDTNGSRPQVLKRLLNDALVDYIAMDIKTDPLKYFSFTNTGGDYKEWPFNQPFHMILNIAVGGNWGGQKGVDENIWPQKMEVDYVRVYDGKPVY